MKAQDAYKIGDKFVFIPDPDITGEYWARQAVRFQRANGGYLTVLSFDMMDTSPEEDILDQVREIQKEQDIVIADIGLSPKNCVFHVSWMKPWEEEQWIR